MMIIMSIKYLLAVIALAALLPGTAQAYYGGDLEVTSELSQACPCDIISSGEMLVELTNYGTKPDTFYIAMEIPEGWSGFILPEVTLSSGESLMLDPAWVTPPCGTDPGKYTVRFSAESAMSGKVAEEELEIELMACHAVVLEGDDFSTCEGQEKVSWFTISNQGNLKETFSLSARPEWVSMPKSVEVEPGAERTTQITASPPEGVTGPQNITITALSRDTYAKATAVIRLDVNKCHYFTASMVPPEEDACLGEPAAYTLHIDNKGTKSDEYMIVAPAWVEVPENNVSVESKGRRSLKLTATPVSSGQKKISIYVSSLDHPTDIVNVEGMLSVKDCRAASVSISPEEAVVCRGEGAGFKVTVNNTGNILTAYEVAVSIAGNPRMETILLEPGQSQEIETEVDVTESVGRYPVTVAAYVENRSVGVKSAYLDVRNCYDASLYLPSLDEDICSGDTLLYDVTVENRGEKADEYEVSYPDAKAEFSIGPGKNATLEAEIYVDAPFGSDAYVPFRLKSRNGVRIEKDLLLTVEELETCHAVEISIASGEEEGKDLYAAKGYGVPVEVRVKNTGIRPDSYDIALSGPEWAHLSADSLQLGPGEEESVYVYLSPTYETEEDGYVIRVLAESGNALAIKDINATVLEEIMKARPGREAAADAGITGMFLIGSLMSFEFMLLSAMTVLTVLIVFMRFVVFR
jgi:uncharacterized membrane protein